MAVEDTDDLPEVRRELGLVLDQLTALPREAIAERGALRARREELTAILRRAADETPSALKAGVRPRDPVDRGRPYIPSRGEGGVGT